MAALQAKMRPRAKKEQALRYLKDEACIVLGRTWDLGVRTWVQAPAQVLMRGAVWTGHVTLVSFPILLLGAGETTYFSRTIVRLNTAIIVKMG